MGDIRFEEIEFLVELLSKYPLESLRSIAKKEGLDYYKLKRIYDKYYRKYLTVSAMYNIRLIGLKSFVAFLAVSPESLLETAVKLTRNPFVRYVNPAFGFKNGLSLYLQIPHDQVELIDQMLGKYSDDFEYYEVRAYTKEKLSDEWGNWDLGYEYAILMDILKWDARTPITEISEKLGKSRPTVRYMINRLKERNILIDFVPLPDMNVSDRGVIGITKELDEEVLKRFRDYEISVGIIPGWGYFLEWFFSSKEDMGAKILEFSRYVEKILVEYFDPTFKELNDRNSRTAFQRMVKKDGSGYRSILEF
ncbi:Lrp/AsnC family transcriptional regulator [Thermococcus peptonophilus]|uniref:Transcriptional regulator n=1 Tax=Thermococcus peptonophilus TaxID=53952 RepID=A0A142CV51_9EURY|nr:Lrp/AsnC family transcriptional regulator [Thermococcus peptonophilus]AMQ18653.1 transcriptional regulator [Thermococcus peptonophilus]